jgi:hypothetical protein
MNRKIVKEQKNKLWKNRIIKINYKAKKKIRAKII